MTEQTEREALEALWKLCEPNPVDWKIGGAEATPAYWAWLERREQFKAMLDAGAYLSAAMMLVPDGYQMGIMQERYDNWQVGLGLWGLNRADRKGEGSTPALALCEAIRAAKDTAP